MAGGHIQRSDPSHMLYRVTDHAAEHLVFCNRCGFYSQAMIRGLEGRCQGAGPSAGRTRMRRLRAGLHPLSQWYIGVPERVFVDPPRCCSYRHSVAGGEAWDVPGPPPVGHPPFSPSPVAILAQVDEEEGGVFPR